jgi:hypothetical protein
MCKSSLQVCDEVHFTSISLQLFVVVLNRFHLDNKFNAVDILLGFISSIIVVLLMFGDIKYDFALILLLRNTLKIALERSFLNEYILPRVN